MEYITNTYDFVAQAQDSARCSDSAQFRQCLRVCVCVCQCWGSQGCMATAQPAVVGKVCDAHIREMKQPPAGRRWRQMLRGSFPECRED